MKPILGIIVLVWFSLHLGQAAVEHNPVAGQEAYIYNRLPSHKSPEEQICTREIVRKQDECVTKLALLLSSGFPWATDAMPETQNQTRNQDRQRRTLGDPLDPINYVCQVFGDFLRCLGPIPMECRVTGRNFEIYTSFTFICHKQPRSIDLLHSLQCLKESRVLDLLVLYLANRPGTHIDDMAQGTVNALFRMLNSSELIGKYYGSPILLTSAFAAGYVCLPERVISHDVSFIIDRKCGAHAADLVRDYYLYYRTTLNSAFSKMGFPDNMCDKETRRNPTIDRVFAAPDYVGNDGTLSREFCQFLEENSPGTGMDTAYGASLMHIIKNMRDRDFCKPILGLMVVTETCFLLSYDPSGKARFNVLEYAHSINNVPFQPFPDSSSLKMLHSCWNLLQQICGHNITYWEYNYRVSAGSSEIQRMMDDLTCEWQGMLIGHYIEASEHGNIWPTILSMPYNAMYLSNATFTFGGLTNSMSDLLSVVSRGVKEISAKCGMASANRIRLFYDRLQYKFYDMLQLEYMAKEKFGSCSNIRSSVWYARV